MGWTLDVHELPGTTGKKIASIPYDYASYTDRINSFGTGTVTIPSDYSRIGEIHDPDSGEGSIVWLKRDGEATDLAFYARRSKENIENGRTTVVIAGPGIGEAISATVVEPYGDGAAMDWIWGGRNILSNPGFENSRNIVAAYELWNDAASGTFTLTVDSQTTGNLQYDATAGQVETALELLSTVTNLYVEGAGIESEPWRVTFADPAFPTADMTVTDTLTGGSSTLDETTNGEVDPTPWTKVQVVERGAPPVIATYATDGWAPHEGPSPDPLSGDYAWRVNGLAAYAGHQQLVRVTPGMTYQVKVPIWTTHSTDPYRVVIRTRMEELVDSSTWPSSAVSATSTWDETTWVIADVVIPDDVTEVIYRFGYVGTGNPDPYYTDDCEMNEGLVPTSAGGVMDVLLDAAQLKGSLSWLVWNFTSSLDSNGVAWTEDALSFTATRGQTLGQVLAGLAKFGVEHRVFWNGTEWELGLYDPYDTSTRIGGAGTDLYTDDSPSLLTGKGIVAGPIQSNTPAATVVYAEGANGLWAEAVDAAAVAIWGRREAFVSDLGVEDQATLDTLAQSQLDRRLLVSGDKLRIVPPSHEPYDAFAIGDTLPVTITPKAKTARRVVGVVTELPTRGSPTATWEVDFDQASYGDSTSIAEGVYRLLSKFDRPDNIDTGSGIPLSTGAGPIEPTFLIASADARPEIQAVADFVCTGVDDQKQIELALAAIDTGYLDAGTIVLTDGYYNFSDEIEGTWTGLKVAIGGQGMFSTVIVSDGDPGTMRDSLISLRPQWSLNNLTVKADHPNYRYAISANGVANEPTYIEHVYARLGTGATDGWGAMEIYDTIIVDRCLIYSIANGIYMGDDDSEVTRSLFVDTGTNGGVNGAAIHLGVSGVNNRAEGNYIRTACVLGIYSGGSDECFIHHNYSESLIQMASGANSNHLVGNYADITIDSGASSNELYGNFGTVSDSGTGTITQLDSPLTTKGDLWGFDTDDNRLPVGTDDYVLTADSAEALGVKWAAATGSGGLDLTVKGQIHTYDTDDAALTVGADGEALFADSGETTGLNWRDVVEADITDLDHTDATAIHDNVASEISAITAKGTPVSGDFLIIEDSAAANAKKSITIGDLPSSGGTPLTTKGDILGYDTGDARIPVGTDDFVLTADSAQALGVKWATPSTTAAGSKATSMMLGGM